MKATMATYGMVAGLAVSLGVLGTAYRSAVAMPASGAPYEGFLVSDHLSARLPRGGTVTVVGEDCPASIERAQSFVSHVLASEDRMLYVIRSGSGIVNPVFQRAYHAALEARPNDAQRIVFVSARDVLHDLNAVATPVFVTLDETGRVVDSGVSTVGLLRALSSPRRIASAWGKMLSAI